MDEAGILSELLPELNRILKFSISKLYFLKHRLLSLQNVQDLEKTNSQADLTTKLVALLVQGTRKPAQKMAEVLSDMVKNNDGSEALEDLIEQIQFKLKSAAAVVRTGGPVTRSRTPAEPNLLDSFGRQNQSPSSPHFLSGYPQVTGNYPLSSSGDSSGYHSEVSSCLSIPGQHNVWYPSQYSGNRKPAGMRLSRCYSDWTISSLRVPYFHDSYFPPPGEFFPEEGSLGFHHPTRPCMLSNHDGPPPGRNKPVAIHSSRTQVELMSTPEEPEKDSPQLRPNSRQKNLDDLCLLVESTHKITSAYSTFTVKVASLLLQNNTDVNTILLWLSCKLSMNGPGCLSIPQNSPIFQAKSVHEVFKELQGFTSWLDYTLTASLAEELGGEEAGSKLVVEYEEKLKPHLEERVAIFHPDYHNTPPVGFQEIKVKLDWDLVKTSYNRVVRFRITLSRILCAQPSSFILKGLREGCVLLTWLVPEYLCPSMLESAKINQDCLGVHAVLAISILGYTIIGKDSPLHEGQALLDSAPDKFSSTDNGYSQDGIHLEGNIPLPTWSQDDCSLSREPARNIGSQSSLSFSSNSLSSSSYDKLQSRPESSSSDQEVLLPTQDGVNHSHEEETISIQSLRRSPKSDHSLLPCYSFSSTATKSTTNSPQETLNSLATAPACTHHQDEKELQSHTVSCPIDEEKESLFFSSSWQYDSTRDESLQHSAVFQQSGTIEEEPKVKAKEEASVESRKFKGRIGTVKKFFSRLVQSVSSHNTSTAVEKETPLSNSVVAASLPNLQHPRLVAQRQVEAQTRIGSFYSQADSGFASRSGSESNSIRRRSIAAISTLTSNCPSQDGFSRQGSFTSTKEGNLSSRTNASTVSLGFPLSHEKRAIEKHGEGKKESMSSLCDSLLKPCSTEGSSVQCSKDSLLLSSFSSSMDDADDEEADLPEQRLMLMTAGCARAYRRKPRSLQYRQEGRKQLRSRNKYSPVKTCNPFATSPDSTTFTTKQKTLPQTHRGKATQQLVPPTSRKEYVSGEFNDILDSLYELNSSFHHSRQDEMFGLSQEDSDSSLTPTSTSPPPPPTPTPDAEMYLSAAWILQDALSNLPDFEEIPRDDNTKISQKTA